MCTKTKYTVQTYECIQRRLEYDWPELKLEHSEGATINTAANGIYNENEGRKFTEMKTVT